MSTPRRMAPHGAQRGNEHFPENRQVIEAAAGAAAPVVMGVWGSEPPSVIPEGPFSWEII